MATTYLPGAVRPANPTRSSNSFSRRALLGGMTVAPALLASFPAFAASVPSNADEWPGLVADYWQKRAASNAASDADDEATAHLRAACDSLPPEPQKPGTGLPDDITIMTIAEIKVSADTPEHKAAWTHYERDHAAWAVQRDALRHEIEGPAEEHASAALDAYCSAFESLTTYLVRTPQELCEKIEIIADDYAGCEIPQERLATVLADVRRLSGLGA